jgi:hypothetical protein
VGNGTKQESRSLSGGWAIRRLMAVMLVATGIVIPCSATGQRKWTAVREAVVSAETDSTSPSHYIGFPRSYSAFGSDGNLYIADIERSAVAVIAPDGKLVTRIGRRGRGPGEFMGFRGLGFRGDTLWVSEDHRTTLFTLDGKVLRVDDMPQGPMLANKSASAMIIRSYLLDGTMVADVTLWKPRAGLAVADAYMLLWLKPSGRDKTTLVDSVIMPSSELPFVYDKQENSTSSPAPSGACYDYASDGRGVVIVQPRIGRGYSVDFRGLSGARKSFDINEKPVKMSPEALSAWIERRAAWTRTAPGNHYDAFTRVLRKTVGDIEFMSPVTEARYSSDGMVWIRREALPIRSSKRGQSVRWDVVDPAGKIAGIVTLPANAFIAAASRRRIWTIEENEDGIQELMSYRIDAGK